MTTSSAHVWITLLRNSPIIVKIDDEFSTLTLKTEVECLSSVLEKQRYSFGVQVFYGGGIKPLDVSLKVKEELFRARFSFERDRRVSP